MIFDCPSALSCRKTQSSFSSWSESVEDGNSVLPNLSGTSQGSSMLSGEISFNNANTVVFNACAISLMVSSDGDFVVDSIELIADCDMPERFASWFWLIPCRSLARFIAIPMLLAMRSPP